MNFISIATMHRAGSGFLSYLLASSDDVMTLPDTTSASFHDLNTGAFFKKSTQEACISDFVKNNQIIFDPSLELEKAEKLGWTRLGEQKKSKFNVEQAFFKNLLKKELDQLEPSFANFIIAVHRAYYKALGKKVDHRKTIVLGTHILRHAINKYEMHLPSHITVFCTRDPVASAFSRLDMEKKIKNRAINFDFFYSLMIYSMDCQFIRLLSSRNVILIRLEDLHREFPNELINLCSKIKIQYNSAMNTPTVNGLVWNGEYWPSSFNSGSADFNTIEQRNQISKERHRNDFEFLSRFIAFDAQDLYPNLYQKKSLLLIIVKQLVNFNKHSLEIKLFVGDLQHSKGIYKKARIFIVNLIKLVSLRMYFFQGISGVLLKRVSRWGYLFIRYGDLINVMCLVKSKFNALKRFV